MRSIRNRWGARVAFAVLWLAVTAGVAFFVAREAAPSESNDDALVAPPIELSDRATTTLERQFVQPVLSGDGSVVADGDGFALEAPVTPQAQAYQLLQEPVSVKALIVGGPAGFDCPWLGLGQGPSGDVTMRCRIPSDIPVVPGLAGTMVLTLVPPVETMVLPVTAVVGAAEQGQVVVVAPDGTTSVRTVEIGISDTFWVEITSGLEPGETVLAAPVQADFAGVSR